MYVKNTSANRQFQTSTNNITLSRNYFPARNMGFILIGKLGHTNIR